jgi:sarcosine oxidase subunit gamma
MSALVFDVETNRACWGVKGPRAAEWLVGRGVALPMTPNSWSYSAAAGDPQGVLVARLGSSEFFLEQAATATVAGPGAAAQRGAGVYPVLREDAAFCLSGEGVHEVLAQVCNVQFEALALDSHPVIMTLMIGVAVLVVPEETGNGAPRGDRRYRIWCDPTYGPSLGETLGIVVVDCGGTIRGVSA